MADTDRHPFYFSGRAGPASTPVGVVLERTVHLTAAQLVALATTPVELVPAAPGRFIHVLSAVARAHPGDTPYTGDGDVINVASIADGAPVGNARVTFQGAAGVNLDGFAVGEPQGGPFLEVEEVGKALAVYYGGGPLLAGNGSLDVTIVYTVI